ncbi:MAG: helix-turn-helix domain-containing protein [Promethearchaeota archaeon]
MRRILFEIPSEFIGTLGFKDLMTRVEKLEVLHVYRFDKKNMYAIQSFKFLNPLTIPSDLVGTSGILFIETLDKDERNNEYVCLVRTHNDKGFHVIFEDFNLMLDFPLVITQETIKIALISPEFQLQQIISHLKAIVSDKYKILNISPIKTSLYHNNLYSLLTKKQIEIMSYAVNKGYFEIPRRISSKEIAMHFNISSSAFNEHVRKVERKIFHILFREENIDSLKGYFQKKKN